MKKPTTKREFAEMVKTAKPTDLIKMGFRWWDDDKKILLIPGSFYNMIPEGYPVCGLSGKKGKFYKKTHENDTRFGVLAYGIIVKQKVSRRIVSKKK